MPHAHSVAQHPLPLLSSPPPPLSPAPSSSRACGTHQLVSHFAQLLRQPVAVQLPLRDARRQGVHGSGQLADASLRRIPLALHMLQRGLGGAVARAQPVQLAPQRVHLPQRRVRALLLVADGAQQLLLHGAQLRQLRLPLRQGGRQGGGAVALLTRAQLGG
jgi:hypothetical protein